MLDIIIKFVSYFCTEKFVLPISIIGFIWVDRQLFYHVICLGLLSPIFNVALKVTFKVPIPKPMSSGPDALAFPSGHTQSPVVFYGYLAYAYQNIYIKLLLILLLASIIAIIIHEKYHGWFDVFGGIFFAFCLIFSYSFLLSTFRLIASYLPLILATLMIIYIYFTYGKIFDHAWMAYYSLIGFVSAYLIFHQTLDFSTTNKILATLICFAVFLSMYPILSSNIVLRFPQHLQKLPWMIMGLVIPSSNFIAKHIISVANKN